MALIPPEDSGPTDTPSDEADEADELLREVGARVRELRRQKGMTQSDLARASGVSVRFLGQLEAGSGNISLGRLSRVARALSAPIAQLVSEASPVLPHGIIERLAELARRRGPEEAERALELARSLLEVSEGTRVALLGIRGAGKTTVGARLAKRLAVPFVELDAAVEQLAGLPLGSIFELHGEGYYRRLEHQALLGLLSRPSFVVATGGSIVTSAEHFALLRAACSTVWLRARPEDHWERVVAQGDARPMRENPRAMDELRALFEARSPLYAQAALTVDTAGRGIDEVVEDIAAALGPSERREASGRR